MSSTLRKPPGALATMSKFRTFRDDRVDVETMNPGSSRARREGCRCSPVANNYGAGPHFTTDPACPLHVSYRLPPIEPGQLRCQCCAQGVDGAARFCSGECRYARRRGLQRSPAYREKMRQIALGRPMSPETRERIAASRRGKTLTAEHRLKISLGQLRRMQSPETRAKQRAAMHGRRRPEGWKLADRTCPCGITYTPTSPNQKWHALDCPARHALPPAPIAASEAAD